MFAQSDRPRRGQRRRRPRRVGFDSTAPARFAIDDPVNPAVQQRLPQIPDYELVRVIGSGSYGDVWLARGVTGVFRAVKIVWRDRFTEVRPYEREFEGVTRFAEISLREPSQLALLHAGRNEAAGYFYYVMELADDVLRGRDIDPAHYVPLTLKELRERRENLPVAEVIELGVALARALASLHATGLVHRDIKPSNLVMVGGVPKLADIGLVAAASEGLTFVGTEGFVPPEGPGAPAADVYSLGKVLYELATGLDRQNYPRLPANLAERPDRRALLELNEVLVRACEPDARARFADAGAVLDELLLLQAGKSVRRLRNAERRTARALRIAVGLAAVAAVAGTGAWVEHQRARRAEAELHDVTRKMYYAATLTRVQRALETEELGLARRLLAGLVPAAGESDLRGFEWQALWTEAQGDPARVVSTGGDIIKRIELSPDQRLIAGQVGDTRTVVWDAATLTEQRTIPGTRLLGGFSTDGTWLIGTNGAQGLQRWRLAGGEADGNVSTGLNFPAQPVGADRVVALVKDSRGLALGLRVWNFSTGRDAVTIPIAVPDPGNWLFMPAPAVTPQGEWCAVALLRQGQPVGVWRLQVYNLTTQRLAQEITPAARTTALAFSPDGKFLALALADAGTICVRDLAGGTVRWEQPAKTSVIDALAFSPDGTRILASGRTSVVRIFDAQDGRILGEFRGHEVGAVDLRWAADGNSFFSAGSGGDLRRWDVRPGHYPPPRIQSGYWGLMQDTQALAVATDGSSLAATTDENRLAVTSVLADGPNLKVEGRFPLAFTDGNTRLAALTAAGELKVHRLRPQPQLLHSESLVPAGATLTGAALSRNGEVLAAASAAGQIWFWRYADRQLLAEQSGGQPFLWLVLAPDGKIAVTNGRDYVVRIWATATGRTLAEFNSGSSRRAFGAAISPDGRWLALCLETGEIEVRDLATFAVSRRIRTDSQVLYSAAFSPDGRLYCGGPNGVVHVYSTDDWRSIVTLTMPAPAEQRDAGIMRLVSSAQGNALVAYRADGTIRRWHAVESGPSVSP
jgi:WD40 repeat protein